MSSGWSSCSWQVQQPASASDSWQCVWSGLIFILAEKQNWLSPSLFAPITDINLSVLSCFFFSLLSQMYVCHSPAAKTTNQACYFQTGSLSVLAVTQSKCWSGCQNTPQVCKTLSSSHVLESYDNVKKSRYWLSWFRKCFSGSQPACLILFLSTQ